MLYYSSLCLVSALLSFRSRPPLVCYGFHGRAVPRKCVRRFRIEFPTDFRDISSYPLVYTISIKDSMSALTDFDPNILELVTRPRSATVSSMLWIRERFSMNFKAILLILAPFNAHRKVLESIYGNYLRKTIG